MSKWAVIDKDYDDFIHEQAKATRQEVLFKGKVAMRAQKDQSVKDTVMFITSFNLYTIKKGVLVGKTLRHNFPILTLKGVHVIKRRWNKAGNLTIRLEFEEESLDIEDHEESKMTSELVQIIIRIWKSISYGFPPGRQPLILVPEEYLAGFIEPKPDVCDGILATYLAFCARFGVSSSVSILEYFMGCFQTENKVFDVSECVGYKEVNDKKIHNKIGMLQLVQVAAALRFTDWFNEFVCVGFPLTDDGIKAFGEMYEAQHVNKAIIVQSSIRDRGAAALGTVLRLGQHNIQFLNLSKNTIGDSGLRHIVKGLSKGERVVHTLVFQQCGITASGMKELVGLLQEPNWRKEIKTLDVSDNRLKKSGSDMLARLITHTHSLIALHLANCELDTEFLFQAILDSPECKLETLDISGNRISGRNREFLLQNILRTTKTLSNVSLKKIPLKSSLAGVMTAILENKNGLKFNLNISECGIGHSGSKILRDAFTKFKRGTSTPCTTSIVSINLSDNALGPDGISNVIDALVGTDIQAVSLNKNLNRASFFGSFSASGNLSEDLCRCLEEWPSLKILSLAGDESSNSLGKTAHTFLKQLKTNKTLTHLNMAGNRLGDEGIQILAESLKVNTKMKTIDIDKNKISMAGVRYLKDMAQENTSLTDWVVPMDDISKICKANPEISGSIQPILDIFESAMDENEERLKERKSVLCSPRRIVSISGSKVWHEDIVTRNRKDTRQFGGIKSTLRFKKMLVKASSEHGEDSKAEMFTDDLDDDEAEAAKVVIDRLEKAERKRTSRAELPSGW